MCSSDLGNIALDGDISLINSKPAAIDNNGIPVQELTRQYPSVMLLDEPFGQLDAQTRMFMQHETVRIWEQEKRTVIFVTNNIDEALFLGDRIVLMEGKLPGTVKTEYCVDLPRPREHTSIALLQLRKLITDNTELVL